MPTTEGSTKKKNKQTNSRPIIVLSYSLAFFATGHLQFFWDTHFQHDKTHFPNNYWPLLLEKKNRLKLSIVHVCCFVQVFSWSSTKMREYPSLPNPDFCTQAQLNHNLILSCQLSSTIHKMMLVSNSEHTRHVLFHSLNHSQLENERKQ